MWPDFIHQDLFSPPRNPITPPGMSNFDEASSPVPPWHTFPNMRHPSDANRQNTMQAQQELRSPAQMPQSLQQSPQVHAQSQLQLQQQVQAQTGGQQQHMPVSGAQHSTLPSQESVDFSEIAQWMGLLDQTASDCKPTDAPTNGRAHAQKHDSFEPQTWAKSGAEACNSRLQMQPQTALIQDKGRTQSSIAQRPSIQNTAGGLPSAAPFGPLSHPTSTLTLQTGPHRSTLQYTNSHSSVVSAWQPSTQAGSARATSKPTSGAHSRGGTARPLQSSSIAVPLHSDSDSLKTNSYGSASIKQESMEHASQESHSFMSDQDPALGSKVTASTSALACMMRKSHGTQRDYSSNFSKQRSEEEQCSRGSSGRQTTSAEADSKVKGKPPLWVPPKPKSGRQSRVKRPPAYLADNIADAQPASKVAKGGKGKAPGAKAAQCGPAQHGSAQRGSAGSKLPAEEPGTLAKLQPFDRFTVSKCLVTSMCWLGMLGNSMALVPDHRQALVKHGWSKQCIYMTCCIIARHCCICV